MKMKHFCESKFRKRKNRREKTNKINKIYRLMKYMYCKTKQLNNYRFFEKWK